MSKPRVSDKVLYLNDSLDKLFDSRVLEWITLYLQTSCTNPSGNGPCAPKYPGRKAWAYMAYTKSDEKKKRRSRLIVALDNGDMIDIGLHCFKKFLR